MIMRTTVSALALGLVAASAAGAQAAEATASTDLNLRAGPGPNHEVLDVITGGDAVSVAGCLEAQNWCEVTYDGATGWAYADYLTAQVDREPVVIHEARDRGAVDIGTATFDAAASGATGAAVGAGAGALAGALLGPIGVGAGAAIGAAAGAGLGAVDTVADYVTANPVEPVYLEGEVVTGAGIPEGVNLYQVPESDFRYAYVNELPVVVRPDDRVIVHIVR